MVDHYHGAMAILAALFAFGSRFVGKILTTALGWASTLLFGRVPAARQYLLLGITFGSVIWMVLLLGVVFPNVGTLLLVLVPSQEIVPENVIRLIMLIGAAIVPAVVGTLTLMLSSPVDRSPRRIAVAVLRGYPLTALLSVLLVFLAGLAIFRKVQSLAKRWTDAHVPMVIQPGMYDQVADDLDKAVGAAGIEVVPRAAPAYMSKPARWLASVAGSGAASLVPERLIQLDGKDLDILIYPMDLLISGKPEVVNRARAAMASRLTTSAAHLTIASEAQEVEDRLMALAQPKTATPDEPARFDEAAASELAAIDLTLADIPIPYEEWEVLYRQRLQVERDLRAGAMAGEAVIGAETPGTDDGRMAAIGSLGRLIRNGAETLAEVAADDRTAAALDKVAGPQWRWAVRLGSVAAVAARSALRGPEEASDDAEADARATAPPAHPDDRPASRSSEGGRDASPAEDRAGRR
ncbi:MAG: hypothetical protein H0U58_04845 [Chloroflexi bacterium]|nr:hypothetical protein [Chloroflexota bacterium]